MMPELGKYTTEVLASYGFTIAVLAGLVWLSVIRSNRVRDALKTVEDRARRNR